MQQHLNILTQELLQKIKSFPKEDMFGENSYFSPQNFFSINPARELDKTIAFIDGGQAELLSAGNFFAGFIRVAAIIMQGNQKIKQEKEEFFLLTTSINKKEDHWFESKIFSENKNLIREEDLLVSSQDHHLKNGTQAAKVSQALSMARRLAELALAAKIDADFILIDGNLKKTLPKEEEFLLRLPRKVAALAKSSSRFTASGNSPAVFLNKFSPTGCWGYLMEEGDYFVKLQEKSKHVLPFEIKDKEGLEMLPYLLPQCNDATFPGYPYGLILADRLARVSNEEKRILQSKILLDKKNEDILSYLSTLDAHDILDQRF